MTCGCGQDPWARQPPAGGSGAGFAEARARAEAVGVVAGAPIMAYVLEPLVRDQTIELAHVTILDSAARVVIIREIGRGNRIGVQVPIGAALRAAKNADCRYLVLSHNHPSGDPWPSVDDARLTADAERAAAYHGLLLLDHLVLGQHEFFSFREEGTWKIPS